MTTPTDTVIGRWRELCHRTRRQATAIAKTSAPRWLKFERERHDFLARVRELYWAVGASLLVVPPGASSWDTEDAAVLGPERLRMLLELQATVEVVEEVEEVEEAAGRVGASNGVQRRALARILLAAALQVAHPHPNGNVATHVLALARALRTEQHTQGFGEVS